MKIEDMEIKEGANHHAIQVEFKCHTKRSILWICLVSRLIHQLFMEI